MASPPGSDRRHETTILVVDDDEPVRRMTARMLRGAGYRVVEAADAGTALEQVIARDPGIDLVVSDVLMPGVTGDELAGEIWAIHPSLPVLFVSGSARGWAEDDSGPSGPHRFLLKPFEAAPLQSEVAALLAEATRVTPAAKPTRGLASRLRDLRHALPAGRTLEPAEWKRRHAFVVAILWAQALAVTIVSLAIWPGKPLHDIGHGAALVIFAIAASSPRFGQRFRQGAAALGLLTSSAVIVHMAGGLIEAHFHYFVMVALLSVYEDWTLFFGAIVYVLAEHGLMSVAEPQAVFAHPGKPWLWSGIHAVAILLLGAVNILTWRFNEDVRRSALQAKSRLAYRALHDELTGLPNRRLLVDEIRGANARCVAGNCDSAAMFVDLDNFKLINDSYGHDAGDRLLVDVARRLQGAVRDTDFVARSGGDEFVVLVRPIHDEDDAVALAARLMSEFDEPFEIAGALRKIGASVGLSLFRPDDRSINDGLARADAAMYSAKADGRGRFRVADDDVLDAAQRRTTIEDALEDFDLADFEVHYQPIVDLDDGSVHAVEALLRWTHPDLGPISPAEFIPLAEDCGRILQLGRWVLERACWNAVRWEALHGRPLKVFVNVSGSQITHPSFANTVSETFDLTGASARNIALEMTETVALDMAAAAANIASLREAGVDLILDDFGVGYSSLSQFTHFPVSLIKVDRSFIAEPEGVTHRAIRGAVVELARGLMIPALAEGIETLEQLEVVKEGQFGLAQGYLFARPQAAGEVDGLLSRARPFAGLLAEARVSAVAA